MVARETQISEALTELGLARLANAETSAKLARIVELLETEGVQRGLVSALDTDRILPRHVLECAALELWLPRSGVVIDVGSGAGLPGLVLAALREDPVVMVESVARRAAFLRDASYELDLSTEVIADRAEAVARGDRRESAAAVVARALARIPVALELTLPLVAVGGLGALLIGSDDAARAADISRSESESVLRGSQRTGAGGGSATSAAPAASAASELGAADPEVHGFEVPGAKERRWVMIVRKVRSTPDLYPRSVQARRRRPLGGDVA